MARGPLQSALREPDEATFERLVVLTEVRLQASLEPVPSWALDGIHTSGNDPRFAGSWEGCLNMCAMYERDGRLDPNRPGILVHEGEKRRRR